MSASGDEKDWRPVVGYEDLYEVSDHGDVRRIAPGSGTRVGRQLRWSVDRKGYPYVSLPGKRCSRVHQLVAQAFIGPGEVAQQVRHLDGNSMNASVDNLRWGTPLENSADRIKHGRATGWHAGQTHCKRGHEFTPENTRVGMKPDGSLYRRCRSCKAQLARERRAITAA